MCELVNRQSPIFLSFLQNHSFFSFEPSKFSEFQCRPPKKQALSDAIGAPAPASASGNPSGGAENVNPNPRLEGGVSREVVPNSSGGSAAGNSNSQAPASVGASSNSKAENSADGNSKFKKIRAPASVGASSKSKAENSADGNTKSQALASAGASSISNAGISAAENSNSGNQFPQALVRYYLGPQTGIPPVVIPPSDFKFSQAATAEGGVSGPHKLSGTSPGAAAILEQNPIRISQVQNLPGNGPAAAAGGTPQQPVASAISQPTFAPAVPQGSRPGDVSAAAGSIATDQHISQMSAEALAKVIGGKIHNLDLEMWIREDIIGAAFLELCASSLLTELLAEFMQQTAANDVETFTCFSKNYRRVVYKFNLNHHFASSIYIYASKVILYGYKRNRANFIHSLSNILKGKQASKQKSNYILNKQALLKCGLNGHSIYCTMQ